MLFIFAVLKVPSAAAAAAAAGGGKKRKKRRKKRDLKLLSFGEEAEEEEIVNSKVGRMLSSHDVGHGEFVFSSFTLYD